MKLLFLNNTVIKDYQLIYELYIKTVNYLIYLNVQDYDSNQDLISLGQILTEKIFNEEIILKIY